MIATRVTCSFVDPVQTIISITNKVLYAYAYMPSNLHIVKLCFLSITDLYQHTDCYLPIALIAVSYAEKMWPWCNERAAAWYQSVCIQGHDQGETMREALRVHYEGNDATDVVMCELSLIFSLTTS